MKKTVLFLTFVFAAFFANSQCIPNPIYQDSLYDIWPDTIQNLPSATQGVSYYTQIDLKVPTTLIEASGGDSSLTSIDTLGTSFYVGDWPVDSMLMIETIGLPSGIVLDCNTPNCSYEGDVVGCGNVSGVTTDPVGVYPISIKVNVYTHGSITIFGASIPVETDLYSATGAYEYIEGYKIIVTSATGLEAFHEDNFSLFQNYPNPSLGITDIRFNSSKSNDVIFKVYNLLGEEIESRLISSLKGINTINLNTQSYSEGVYLYSINNGFEILTRRMIIKN